MEYIPEAFWWIVGVGLAIFLIEAGSALENWATREPTSKAPRTNEDAE